MNCQKSKAHQLNKWLLGFLCGHGLALLSPRLPSIQELTLIIVSIVLFHKLKKSFLFAFLLGLFCQLSISVWAVQPNTLDYFIENQIPVKVTGVIAEPVVIDPSSKGDAQKLIIQVLSIEGLTRGTLQKEIRVVVYVYESNSHKHLEKKYLKQGNLVTLRLKLKRPIAYENIAGFNQARHLYSHGISAIGSTQIKDIHRLSNDITKRQKIADWFVVKVTENEMWQPFVGTVLTLMTADSSLLSINEKQSLSHLGLSHLMAISGLHIGLMYLLLLWLGRLFSVPKGKQIFALSAVWLFVFMIDAPPSAFRAALIISIYQLSLNLVSNHSMITRLLVVAFFTVLIEPKSWLDVSWWLSFYAVLGIMLFARLVTPQQCLPTSTFRQRAKENLILAIQFQMFITTWMAPIIIYFFGGYNFASALSNLLFWPVFILGIIPALFIMVLTYNSANSVLDHWSNLSVDLIAKSFNLMVSLFDAIGITNFWAYFSNNELQTMVLLLFVMPMFLCFVTINALNKKLLCISRQVAKVLSLSRKMNISSIIAIASIIFGLVVLKVNQTDVTTEPNTLYVFDVGQGSANMITNKANSHLFDLGPVFRGGSSATERTLLPNLLALGITQVSSVTLSHLDADHKGDPKSLSRALGSFVLYHCNDEANFPNNSQTKNLNIEILWPRSEIGGSWQYTVRNDKSCVIKVTSLDTGSTVLFPGDISEKVERRLVDLHYAGDIDLRTDILISPHHGSKYSSTLPFIYATKPKIVIHSASANNRFGFPTKEVTQRYKRYDIKQYSTARHGMITVNLSEPDLDQAVSFQLNEWTAFWKRQNPFSIQQQIR